MPLWKTGILAKAEQLKMIIHSFLSRFPLLSEVLVVYPSKGSESATNQYTSVSL
jgi:hypothetical protein